MGVSLGLSGGICLGEDRFGADKSGGVVAFEVCIWLCLLVEQEIKNIEANSISAKHLICKILIM